MLKFRGAMAARSLFARTSFPLCFGLGAGFQLASLATAPITTVPAMYTPYTTYGHLPLSTVVSESSQCPLLLRFQSKPRFFNYIPDRNNDFPSMGRGNGSLKRIGDTAFWYVRATNCTIKNCRFRNAIIKFRNILFLFSSEQYCFC